MDGFISYRETGSSFWSDARPGQELRGLSGESTAQLMKRIDNGVVRGGSSLGKLTC
jgi:hypothetical protein